MQSPETAQNMLDVQPDETKIQVNMMTHSELSDRSCIRSIATYACSNQDTEARYRFPIRHSWGLKRSFPQAIVVKIELVLSNVMEVLEGLVEPRKDQLESVCRQDRRQAM